MRVIDFRAMGSPCRLVVDGGPSDLADRGVELVRELERRWSRFCESSEVSALNANAGNVSIVSDATFALIQRSCEARLATAGVFNPLMLDQLECLGYAESWTTPPSAGHAYRSPATDLSIETLPEVNGVVIPSGTRFDAGGIGKGLAIDMVTELLTDGGATTTSVELGGDLRVGGESWLADGWQVDVSDPFGRGEDLGTFRPTHGAVATSSRLRRRWSINGVEVHHLLDPSTGLSADTDLVAVTTCSSSAWWAEVSAKTVLISGSDLGQELLRSFKTPGVMVSETGETTTVTAADPKAQTTQSGPPITPQAKRVHS